MATRREFMAWAGAAAAAGVFMPRIGLGGLATRADRILGWEEVRPGIFAAVHARMGGNVLACVGKGGVLVIDTKYPFVGPALRADALALAGGGVPVTLINTHHHGDHTGGNVGFAGQGPIMAHRNAADRIVAQVDRFKEWAANGPAQAGRIDGANRELQRVAQELAARADDLAADDWKPSEELGDSGPLPFEGVEGEVRHFGAGHTDNDLVIRFAEANVVHTGDLVFNALHPYFDPDGGVTARGWVRSLRGARELCDEKTVVVPGHGPVGDRSIIDGQIRYLEQLIEAVQGEIDAGVTREQALEKEYPFMVGLGFAQVRGRAIGAVYDELSKPQG
ncbi:MAG: cyclase [Phycisphaeraceae bacterium]|nr:MAG: cyclase [Phycisphaeraceae bacterium]